MIKIIALIKKLPHLSMSEFMDYYESNHAPLIMRLFPMIIHYKRNYSVRSVFDTTEPEYAAVTELEFASEEDYATFVKLAVDPQVREQFARDEAHLLQSSETRMMVVKTVAS